jgi:hemolysin activation/secretion protein
LGADVVFTVQAVQVLGATRFTPAELLAVAGFEAGQSSNLPALQSMADRITRHYQKNGYLLARAHLPTQDIRDGVVRLAVLEGQYGQIRLNNTSTLDSAVAQNVLAGRDVC